MSVDVIVVGAGLGGLSSAIALAAEGYDVELVEAGHGPGGKAGEATVDGVAFDTGPSLLTMPDVLEQVFARAGRHASDYVTLRPLSPAFHYRFADGLELEIAHTLEETRANVLRVLGPAAMEELDAFLAYAKRIWDASAPSFVYGEAPTAARLARMDWRTLWGLTQIDAHRSMWRGITRHVRNPHLQTLLARYATYNGSDVRQAPATLNCIAYVELALGGFGIEGGVFAMVRALEALARDLGVRFHYGTRVEGLAMDGRRVIGVETAQGTRRARSVVANADAAQVARTWLSDTSVAAPRVRLAASMSGWNGVIRARRREDRAAHEVLFDTPYLQEFADIFDAQRAPSTPTIYLCAQEKAHGRTGWAEHEPLFVMVNAPSIEHVADPDGLTAGVATRVLERLRALGRIDADDALVWERHPVQLAASFPGSHGGIYGSASNSRFAAFLRPANASKHVDGLYYASGSAHPGGGMPLCMLSGLRAADALARRQTREAA